METTRVEPIPEEELLTLDEVATRLKMSRRTVERLIRKGALAPARLGGRGGRLTTLVHPDEVERYLNEQRSVGYKFRARARKAGRSAAK